MGPSHCPPEGVGVQGAWPRPRQRLCLLKGCEQPFQPTDPQARYCSSECRAAARRWRCWRASRTYRASDRGHERRREQARRYRERRRELQTAQEAPEAAAPAPREGQRPAADFENSEKSCCARPGCYELFKRTGRSPLQKCCGGLCRQALRRVRERAARWRRRSAEPEATEPISSALARASPGPERRILPTRRLFL